MDRGIQIRAAQEPAGKEDRMPDDVARTLSETGTMKVAHASEKKPVMVAGRRDF